MGGPTTEGMSQGLSARPRLLFGLAVLALALLAAGGTAAGRLESMAEAGSPGYMLPEQVWDENPPSDDPGFSKGEGTFSTTPLAWTHAQYVRLAWSIDEGHPIEQPSIVAARYPRAATAP